jgi:hypothetical protein
MELILVAALPRCVSAPWRLCVKFIRTLSWLELSNLRAGAKRLLSSSMKLALAALVYLLIALTLSVGILLTIAGKPWLLIVAFVAYAVAFAKIGCLSQH